MSKRKLGLVFVGVIILMMIPTSWLYVSTTGVPWKKAAIGEEIHAHLEEKYNTTFEIKHKGFNFRGGTYEITAFPKGEPEVAFLAEERQDGKGFNDYYPESYWEQALIHDLQPVAEKSFPNIEQMTAISVKGEGAALVEGPDIPNYSDVGATLSMRVDISEEHEDTDQVWENLYLIVKAFAGKMTNGDITFSFDATEAKTGGVAITCKQDVIPGIQNKADVKNECHAVDFRK